MDDKVEFHILNRKGRAIHVFEDGELARLRLPNFGTGCSLVEVRKTYTVLTTNMPAVTKPAVTKPRLAAVA